MVRSILVPLDGSPFGEHALPTAVSLARRGQAALHLLHVHTLLDSAFGEIQLLGGERLEHAVRETEWTYLNNLKMDIEKKTGVTVVVLNADGATEPTIRSYAVENTIDLVVMTTHARGTLGRFWLGSVDDELLRDLPMPLLLVHAREAKADLAEEVVFEHILVPLDGTALAEHILAPAADLAAVAGADLTLLRVVEPAYPVALPVEPGPFGTGSVDLMDSVVEIHRLLCDDAEAYLQTIAVRLRERGLQVRTLVTVEAEVGSAICEQAHKPIDLVALETHGRHGLTRLLLGSIADRVIRHTPLPVLVHASKA